MDTEKKRKKQKFFKKEDLTLHAMALPVFLFLVIFAYLPMIGLVIAFQSLDMRRGVFTSPFIGLKNFEFLFSTDNAFIITRNTVLYNIAYISSVMVLAVIVALILSSLRSKRSSKVLQTIYMMPYFLSYSVVAIAMLGFLDQQAGMVNQLLSKLTGVADWRQWTNWYQTPPIWPPFLITINAWKNIGYSTVLYLAVISGIPTEYYEAAVIDGAGKFQQAIYITLPHLRFIISISLIMSTGGMLRGDFGLHYLVTRNQGVLYPATDIIDTFIYRGLLYLGNIGMSTAAGLYQSVVGFILILIANRIVTKIDPDTAMF